MTAVAVYLQTFLTAQGYRVFIDLKLQAGQTWLEEIDRQIRTSHFFIALLSGRSGHSEMVQLKSGGLMNTQTADIPLHSAGADYL